MALKMLSHENCPRWFLETKAEQVVPLLEHNDDLVKYLAIYAFYSNLRLARKHLAAIKKHKGYTVVSGNRFKTIVDRVEIYVERFDSVDMELTQNFKKNLALAKENARHDDDSWVNWAMEWVWDDFNPNPNSKSEDFDHKVHLCSRLLDDEYVGECWLHLTRTLQHHQKASWLQTHKAALAKHMTIVNPGANQPDQRSLARNVLFDLKADSPSLRNFKVDVQKLSILLKSKTSCLTSSPTFLKPQCEHSSKGKKK